MRLDSAAVVDLLQLHEPELVERDQAWDVWRYNVLDPASDATVLSRRYLAFAKSRSTWPSIASLQLPSESRATLSVLVQRSSPLATDLERLRTILSIDSARVVASAVSARRRRVLGSPQASHPDPHFVEPFVAGHGALDTLKSWLVPPAGTTDKNLAVLLAPAGVGKTSLVRELERQLQRTDDGPLPLIVEPKQWLRLATFERPTLWSLFQCALQDRGLNVPSQEVFETMTRVGAVIPIFDGMDEVGTLAAGLTSIHLLEQLQAMADDSDCRILVTSRDGLWNETVPPEFKKEFREFVLQPFGTREIARYREKRFPVPGAAARDRFDKYLDKVLKVAHPNLRQTTPGERIVATPLTLFLLAEEAESDETELNITSPGIRFQHPIYVIVQGTLTRESAVRRLALSPLQQFELLANVAAEAKSDVFAWDDVLNAAEQAYGKELDADQRQLLRDHPFFVVGDECRFRYPYIAKFVPAVWFATYLERKQERERITESAIVKLAGSPTSAVHGYICELLSGEGWSDCLRYRVARASKVDIADRNFVAALWQLAQSLLTESKRTSRSERGKLLLEMFGDTQTGCYREVLFTGLISSVDFRGATFEKCVFRDCEWVVCEFDRSTLFRSCEYSGTFRDVQGSSLRHATFENLTGSFVDETARDELALLLDRRALVVATTEQVRASLIGLLTPFYCGGYCVPVGFHVLESVYVGSRAIKTFLIDSLCQHQVIEEVANVQQYRVASRATSTVKALLDNGAVIGSLRGVLNKTLQEFPS